MIKSTGSLGYSLLKEDGQYVPYLINPHQAVANISFYDPKAGFFALGVRNKETGDMDIIDSGYPPEEFRIALKDAQRDDKPVTPIKVEELGAGDEMGVDEQESIHKISTLMLEFSPIEAFVYEGFDEELNRYIYTARLENGHAFQIQIESAREAKLMRMIDFSDDKVAIDGMPCDVYWLQPEDSDEARFLKLMEIYYSRVISINLDV